jgi:hypothetical protein
MRYFAFVFILLALFIASAFQVDAHILKSSGSIGAVMHVTPEDDPVAREQSDFFFEFKDKENKFLPENCDCTVFILQSGKEIFSQPLFANNRDPSLENASFSFTFPERGIYIVKIIGKPLTSGAYKNFILEYPLRVEKVSKGTASAQGQIKEEGNWFSSHFIHFAPGILIIVILVWLVVKKRRAK